MLDQQKAELLSAFELMTSEERSLMISFAMDCVAERRKERRRLTLVHGTDVFFCSGVLKNSAT